MSDGGASGHVDGVKQEEGRDGWIGEIGEIGGLGKCQLSC